MAIFVYVHCPLSKPFRGYTSFRHTSYKHDLASSLATEHPSGTLLEPSWPGVTKFRTDYRDDNCTSTKSKRRSLTYLTTTDRLEVDNECSTTAGLSFQLESMTKQTKQTCHAHTCDGNSIRNINRDGPMKENNAIPPGIDMICMVSYVRLKYVNE